MSVEEVRNVGVLAASHPRIEFFSRDDLTSQLSDV